MKMKTAEEIGIKASNIRLPSSTSEHEVNCTVVSFIVTSVFMCRWFKILAPLYQGFWLVSIEVVILMSSLPNMVRSDVSWLHCTVYNAIIQ